MFRASLKRSARGCCGVFLLCLLAVVQPAQASFVGALKTIWELTKPVAGEVVGDVVKDLLRDRINEFLSERRDAPDDVLTGGEVRTVGGTEQRDWQLAEGILSREEVSQLSSFLQSIDGHAQKITVGDTHITSTAGDGGMAVSIGSVGAGAQLTIIQEGGEKPADREARLAKLNELNGRKRELKSTLEDLRKSRTTLVAQRDQTAANESARSEVFNRLLDLRDAARKAGEKEKADQLQRQIRAMRSARSPGKTVRELQVEIDEVDRKIREAEDDLDGVVAQTVALG